MAKYRRKGLAASVEAVDAERYHGDGLYRDVIVALGLPWSPGRGTHAAYTDLRTGEFQPIPGRTVLPGHWVVRSAVGIEVMDPAAFEAEYEPLP